MLKIKSNTNEFTIIFFWEDSKENKCWKNICSSPLFLFLSAPHTSSFFLFPGQPSLFLLLFSSSLLFLFFRCVAFYFSAQNTFFQPKRFLAFQPKCFSAQKHFFQPKTFFSSAQNVYLFIYFFSVHPLFSSSFFCFILFWFSPLFSLSMPPFFLFFSSVYPRPNVLFSCFTSLLFE